MNYVKITHFNLNQRLCFGMSMKPFLNANGYVTIMERLFNEYIMIIKNNGRNLEQGSGLARIASLSPTEATRA